MSKKEKNGSLNDCQVWSGIIDYFETMHCTCAQRCDMFLTSNTRSWPPGTLNNVLNVTDLKTKRERVEKRIAKRVITIAFVATFAGDCPEIKWNLPQLVCAVAFLSLTCKSFDSTQSCEWTEATHRCCRMCHACMFLAARFTSAVSLCMQCDDACFEEDCT